MTREQFKKLFEDKIIIFDGASGTQLHKMGMPSGVCPEKWAVENPECLKKVHKGYLEAGSEVIYTFTFGGNAIKLDEYGLKGETFQLNKRLVEIAREATEGKCLIAGDISSGGILLEPYGDITFEQSVESFKEQIKGLLAGGVDLLAIETMLDIQEARAALIAARELCDLPVLVTITFESAQRTLMGTDALSALVTLQSLGADAVGCNCSSGPAEMVGIIETMKPYAKVPLIAKPNAGKPRLVNGETVFDMDADAFAGYTNALIKAGVNGLGGCCGTNADFIQKLVSICKDKKPYKIERKTVSLVSSYRKTVAMSQEQPLTVIGERLNPTGKKALKEALKEKDMDEVSDIAREQYEAGASILDVNAGVPGINEKEILPMMVQAVGNAVPLPVCLDSSDTGALKAALRTYPGRAIINSISGEHEKLTKVLPLAAKFGAMFVLLPMDDHGVPETAEERITIIKHVYNEASKYGFTKEDILVDGLVMAVASNQKAAYETLKVIEWCSREFGVNTVIGLSNVSFGLPNRDLINSAFLSMAVAHGLSTAIMNPNHEGMMAQKRACDVLASRDNNAMTFIMTAMNSNSESALAQPAEKTIYDAVLRGLAESTEVLVKEALANGSPPQAIIDEQLIPAIQKVGAFYEQKKYFLPQLIKGAETMQKAMAILEPLLADENKDTKSKGTIVIATVKGDVHDIGKNIVALLLKNHGFVVHDLGKDVEAIRIIEAAKEHNADIIALSALMTTTMGEMPKIAEMAKEAGLSAKIMVGGAVLDQAYAESFGAYFSSDAYAAVRLAEELTSQG